MRQITIVIEDIKLKATLLNTPTANAIFNALPLSGQTQTWGDEIYFSIPVNMDEDDEGREELGIGDLAYWLVGAAFCFFYGRTPISTSDKSRAYSPVNVFGKIEGNTETLKRIEPNSLVLIKK